MNQSATMPAATAYVGDLTAEEERSRGMAWLGGAASLGMVCGLVMAVFQLGVVSYLAKLISEIQQVAAGFILMGSGLALLLLARPWHTKCCKQYRYLDQYRDVFLTAQFKDEALGLMALLVKLDLKL